MNKGEKGVVRKMIVIYCKSKHKPDADLCEDCLVLNNYAMMRLERCPFGEGKPTCGTCPIHCYKKDMREKIREVMRFSGPRMIYRHPVDALRHLLRENKRKRTRPATVKN